MKSGSFLSSSCLVCLAVSLSLAAENGGEDTELKNAIRHRCVLECVWAKERSGEQNDGEAFMKQCAEGCMNDKAIEAALKATAPDGWGVSKEKAIEVCLPSGENYFLQDLHCFDGTAPEYNRSGNVGSRNPMPENLEFSKSMMDPTRPLKPGEIDYHIIDRYEVKCPGGQSILFFDMYHCGAPKPWLAPRGFTRPPRG